jgi:hypothetical protein
MLPPNRRQHSVARTVMRGTALAAHEAVARPATGRVERFEVSNTARRGSTKEERRRENIWVASKGATEPKKLSLASLISEISPKHGRGVVQ